MGHIHPVKEPLRDHERTKRLLLSETATGLVCCVRVPPLGTSLGTKKTLVLLLSCWMTPHPTLGAGCHSFFFSGKSTIRTEDATHTRRSRCCSQVEVPTEKSETPPSKRPPVAGPSDSSSCPASLKILLVNIKPFMYKCYLSHCFCIEASNAQESLVLDRECRLVGRSIICLLYRRYFYSKRSPDRNVRMIQTLLRLC